MGGEDPSPKVAAPGPGLAWRLERAYSWARRLLFQQLPADEARTVRQGVETDGAFTERFVLMCALSSGIATIGLLQSSSAVVIGAMLVSPMMGPIAALGVAFASLDGMRIQAATRTVFVGAITGVVVGMLLTWFSPLRNATPEIVARTAPTLLDLVVALLSGFAGGYATVHHKGEAAIGVAIATALMPPLATLGYSLAVMRPDFAGGAGLLFLTNLAAIAFAFALVARLRGVARPLRNVEFKPQYVALGLGAFLLLATPLALSLVRITQESQATVIARREITRLLDVDASQIAQLTVAWKPLEAPHVSAIVITPAYSPNADAELHDRLSALLGRDANISLRQVVAADTAAQAQAMIDAALEHRTAEQIAAAPPLSRLRDLSAFPTIGAWPDESAHAVVLLPAPMEGVTLAAYRAEETRLNGLDLSWRVVLIPPFQQCIAIGSDSAARYDDAAWALHRWGVQRVDVSGANAEAASAALSATDLQPVVTASRTAGAQICASPRSEP